MSRVAIPMREGKLSEYFGQSNHYQIFDIEEDQIMNTEIAPQKNISLKNLPGWVAKNAITDLITHRIDKSIIDVFNLLKVNLFIGIQITDAQEIIKDYLNGTLQSNKHIINEIISSDDR